MTNPNPHPHRIKHLILPDTYTSICGIPHGALDAPDATSVPNLTTCLSCTDLISGGFPRAESESEAPPNFYDPSLEPSQTRDPKDGPPFTHTARTLGLTGNPEPGEK